MWGNISMIVLEFKLKGKLQKYRVIDDMSRMGQFIKNKSLYLKTFKMHHNPISIKNLSYSYPDGTQALKDVNISIKANERVALIGANGSGKSTLQLHLNGILMPEEGEITIGEMPVTSENLRTIRNFVGLEM